LTTNYSGDYVETECEEVEALYSPPECQQAELSTNQSSCLASSPTADWSPPFESVAPPPLVMRLLLLVATVASGYTSDFVRFRLKLRPFYF